MHNGPNTDLTESSFSISKLSGSETMLSVLINDSLVNEAYIGFYSSLCKERPKISFSLFSFGVVVH